MHRSVFLALWRAGLFLGAMSLFNGAVLAQNETQLRGEIVRLYKKGEALAIQKKYGAALLKFKAASALYDQMRSTDKDKAKVAHLRRRHANLLYIIGRTHELNKQPKDAFRYFVKSFRSNPTPALKGRLLAKIQSLRSKVLARLYSPGFIGQSSMCIQAATC